jgi:hypothetical protein
MKSVSLEEYFAIGVAFKPYQASLLPKYETGVEGSDINLQSACATPSEYQVGRESMYTLVIKEIRDARDLVIYSRAVWLSCN